MHGGDGRGRAERHLNTGEKMKTSSVPFFSHNTFLMYSARTGLGCKACTHNAPSPLLSQVLQQPVSPTHPPRHPSTSPPHHHSSNHRFVSSSPSPPRRRHRRSRRSRRSRHLFHSCLAISFLFFFASSLLFETPVADPSGCYESALPLVSHSE